ncbi:MAG: DUF4329 domain-containing protein [Labilithrix sp.]
MEGVVGNGNSTGLAPNGEAEPGEEFTLNQPTHLAMSEDGYLFIAHSLGVAVYDTQSKEAEMLFVDGGRDEILPFFTEQSTPLPSFLPFTKNALMAMSDSGLARVNIDLLSSEADPTRTIVRNASGGFTLTDTSQAIVDKFDVRGRLIEHRRRTGKLLYAIQYSDADSDRIDRITNATGGAFVFAYDSGKLSRITDPAGAGSAITVDAQGDLTQIVEPDGEKHRFVYDRHHVTVKTDPRGDETHYTYATDGTLASTLKPTGEAHELHASISAPAAYTAGGKLQTTSSFTDPHGVVHTFVQNDYGEIEKETFVADGVTYTHDAVIPDQLFTTGGTEPFILRRANAFRRISQWTLNGVPLTNPVSFDSLGRVVSSARQGSGSGNVTRWTYDANGWLSSESPGGALLAQFIERDSDGRILRIYDAGRGSGGASPTGRETTFAWRPDDQPLSVRTHNVTTTFAYDDAGGTKNLLATSDSTGRSMTYVRDARGNAISSTDGTASAFFDFDSNNRLMRSSDALGNETTFSYEHSSCGCSAQDLVTGIHTPDLPAGVEWAFAYGPNGRLTKVTDPHGFSETMTYKVTGEVETVKDRLGRTSSMTYDQLGRLTALIDIADRAHAQSYAQPTAGAWTGPSLSAGSASSAVPSTSLTAAPQDGDYQIGLNAFDVEGYPARIALYRDATFELGYTRAFDIAGRLTNRFDRANRAITSTSFSSGAVDGTFDDHFVGYDTRTSAPLVRSTTSTTSTGAESSVTNHDVELDATDESGFGVGIEAPSSHVFTRDTAGRLKSSTNRFYTGVVTSDPLVITADASRYDYRADGRIARITNVDGAHEFTYDARGLVQTQTIGQGGTGESGTYAYGYDEVGRNISLTFADGHVRTQRYDDLGRLVERCYTYPTRPGISDRCYGASYDAVGNVVSLSDPEGTETIEVDGLDRVKTVTRSTGGVESYAYNSLGALATNAGVALDAQRPRLDGAGMADAAVPATLGGGPVTLDRGGRVTLLRNTPLTFSRDGYLRDVGSGPTLDARFAVDTQRRRAWVSTPSELQAYVYEGANAVGVMRHRHVLGQHLDTPVQRWLFDGVDHPLRLTSFDYKVNTTTSPPTLGSDYNVVYFEVDLAGNVRRVRGQSGEDFGGFRYTAFGMQLEDTTSLGFLQPVPEISLRWKGRPRQVFGGTEVYDMRARQWVPEMGSFLSIDEYAFQNPRSTLWGWPGQNPIRWSDPSGRRPGDPYASPDAAARAAQFDYTWISVSQNIELSSSIYATKDAAGNTTYSYTPAETEYRPNQSDANNAIPSGSKLAAHFHTHPGGAPADEKFSTGDKKTCSAYSRPEYLATPKGNLLRYNTNVPWSPSLQLGDDSFVSRELGSDVRNLGNNPLALLLAPMNRDVLLDAALIALGRSQSSTP